MRFSCDECGRSYVAADEVSGRAFRMRCKECGHEIVVRPPIASAPVTAVSTPAATPDTPVASASRPPARGAPGPASAAKVSAAKTEDRAPPRGARPAFDPFEGQDVAADVTVATGSLEILDKTPPAVRLPPASRPESAPAPSPGASASTGATSAAARPAATPGPTLPPRARRARMLPAEDEEMLGPPGEEGRGGFPRWIVAAVVAGLAALGGFLWRR